MHSVKIYTFFKCIIPKKNNKNILVILRPSFGTKGRTFSFWAHLMSLTWSQNKWLLLNCNLMLNCLKILIYLKILFLQSFSIFFFFLFSSHGLGTVTYIFHFLFVYLPKIKIKQIKVLLPDKLFKDFFFLLQFFFFISFWYVKKKIFILFPNLMM